MTVVLSGYRIGQAIYRGTRTLVYRGVRECDNQPVAIKFLANPYPTFSELLHFRNQYAIAKNLNIPGIVHPESLEPYGNSYALVMEDGGDISLNDSQFQLKPLTVEDILSIAIQLADILHQLHQNRVIHKDIKPANILIDPETKQVKLIDFSIASLLPQETQEIKNPNVLEGTLAYISPEQTGRMNRGIDYRSDFYSLGVTLFELLAGKLPFTSLEPMELVHSHIAKTPPELANEKFSIGNREEIPKVLSDIVLKLMAKNAEDRYQSALGLKFDLDKCLIQIKETRKIESFQIGSRDVCDRFLIPEKLYGREKEVQQLLEAFDRIAGGSPLSGTELMLIAGFSGIGKTAVVNEVHKPITRQRGYFIKGKFDQFNCNIPLSAFVQAFRNLIGQLLSETDAQLEVWRSQILEAIGKEGKVLIEVIPELESLLGKQPTVEVLSGIASQQRFNFLFQKFLRVFTRPQHPLVLFLDDLQWADSASLKLLELLMADSDNLLILGAYRDNEVSPIHPFMQTVDALVKVGRRVNTITLQPLDRPHMNHLVADTLGCDSTIAAPLTELIAQKTQGNPFFTTQFLKGLHQDRYITFNWETGIWECDIVQVRSAALTDDVVTFMVRQLQKLPTLSQFSLQQAACIGNRFDLKTLAIICEQTEQQAAAALWPAIQAGLILPISETYKFFQSNQLAQAAGNFGDLSVPYKFLHDRIQQAAYSLIPDDQKTATHLKIGRLLQQNYLEIEQEEKVFEIVGHLNRGRELITQLEERITLAQMNLKAGIKARNATAYTAARTYLQTGIACLEVSNWQTQYELTLNLYVAATEVDYLNNDFVDMAAKATLVLQKAQTILDKVKIHEIQIAVYISQSNVTEAIALGCDVLAILGVEFIPDPDDAIIGQALQKLSQQLSTHKIEDLVNLPPMSNAQIKAAMSLFRMLFTPILQGKPGLMPLLSATMVSLSLEFGNAPASAVGYVLHGLVLCAFLGDVQTGYRFGILAVSLLEQLPIRSLHSMTLALFSTFIQHHQEPLHTAILTVKKGYRLGMETGDVLYAGYNSCNYFSCCFFAGVEIENFELESANYSASMGQAKQYSAQSYLDMGRQTMQNLTETVSQIDCLQGSIYDETVMLPQYYQKQEFSAIAAVYIYKLLLAYLFGDYQNAADHGRQAHQYLLAVSGFIIVPIFYFYAALTQLALDSQEPDKILAEVANYQTSLHSWAENAPMNYSHKWYLVEAEKYLVMGNKAEAIEHYDRAIFLAKANRFLNEEALANELAAKFYLAWGKEKVAASYMQSAYYCYAKWGAKAKIDDLEKRYPDLLDPILQQALQRLSTLETLASISTSNLSIHTATKNSICSNASINITLDLSALIKASQSLSGTIQINELLHKITQIILQNSGADRCALILPDRDGKWLVKAIATPEITELCSQPLAENPNLPVKLIQYVKNTQEIVAIDDLNTELPVIVGYLEQQKPKSISCFPLLERGNLSGILYLENLSTSGVFTSDRILILNFLCSQVAISLENARLHALEQEKSERLEQSQRRLQLIIQQTPVAVIEWNSNFEFQSWNPAAEKIFSFRAEEAIGSHFRCIIPQEYHAYVDDVANAILAQRGGSHAINENLTKEGLRIICEWFNAPILNLEGEVVGGVSMAVDITDRKRYETAIEQKSQELERALSKLQHTQLQVVQSEKMASLGNLVAGVAHEINNPIGFLNGSINNAKDYVQDLLEHLALYQQYYPNAAAPIQENAEDIDLEFTIADLPKLVNSMQGATDRIKNISTSLRTFSRADTEYKIRANLHDGLDSTLLILKYRLKADDKRPAIEIIKDYGELPEIKCFPGQLNQVFMNLLANAIDIFDELVTNYSFEYLEANPQKITIQTEVVDNIVFIRIRDNGKGMIPEVTAKIFDHLFTTKPVGKGTGLGLAIARQIIVEKHQGDITVNSVLSEGTEFVIALPVFFLK